MSSTALSDFITAIRKSFTETQFVKATFGKPFQKNEALKNVFIKPVMLKQELQLSFVYRYSNKDITKNMTLEDGLLEMVNILKVHFRNADAFTTKATLQFISNKDATAKLIIKSTSNFSTVELLHDHQKKRLIGDSTARYLQDLSISNAEGHIKKDMQAKFKQINRYVEIVADILKDLPLGKTWRIMDMGSGKGYLTFALYYFLANQKKIIPQITGVEQRSELVEFCNTVAAQNHFTQLNFIEGNIQDSIVDQLDMLIALHACDTATDDAIIKGIAANAQIIVCAPCCHKQIRAAMKPTGSIKNISKHGILLERQAEILTDTIRALILESKGYKTRVFDFIAWEHTPKNVLIVAEKNAYDAEREKSCMAEVQKLKELFGIEYHYLEKQLNLASSKQS